MTHLADTPEQLVPQKVLMRFGMRTAILILFASFGSIGFGRSFAALLWMTIILCAVIGAIRRERVLTAGLNHWDEMVAYTALYCAVTETAVGLVSSVSLRGTYEIVRDAASHSYPPARY